MEAEISLTLQPEDTQEVNSKSFADSIRGNKKIDSRCFFFFIKCSSSEA